MATNLGEDGCKHLDLLGERGGVMFPVHLNRSLSKEQGKVKLGIDLA